MIALLEGWRDDIRLHSHDDVVTDGEAAAALRELQTLFASPPAELEALGRLLVQRLVLVAQACLLRQHAPAAVADAFIATRLGDAGAGRVVGAIDARGMDVGTILARALPA